MLQIVLPFFITKYKPNKHINNLYTSVVLSCFCYNIIVIIIVFITTNKPHKDINNACPDCLASIYQLSCYVVVIVILFYIVFILFLYCFHIVFIVILFVLQYKNLTKTSIMLPRLSRQYLSDLLLCCWFMHAQAPCQNCLFFFQTNSNFFPDKFKLIFSRQIQTRE